MEFLVIIGAAAVVATIFHIWKLPPVVAFFTAGAIIGPYGLGWVDSSEHIEIMTEGAAIFLMFTIGLEFSLAQFSAFRRPLIYLGFGQILLCLACFLLLFYWAFGYSFEKSVFLSFLVSLSSTAVVMKMLTEHRDFESPHGRTAFAVLLAQDIAVIPMIVTIPFLVRIHDLASSFFDSLLPLVLLIVIGLSGLFALNRFILPAVFRKVAHTNSREVFFFFVILLVALLSGGMHAVGLSYSLGAFLAGMLIAGSAYGKQATADFVPLRDAFLGLFFVIVGTLLDLQFLFNNLPLILAFAVLAFSLKALIIFLLVWLSGNSGTVSRVSSLLLFQMGEFSFILADQGFKLHLMSAQERQYFMAIAILSLAATPLAYRLLPWLSQSEKFRNAVPLNIRTLMQRLRTKYLALIQKAVEAHQVSHKLESGPQVLIIGFGVAGKALAKALRAMKVTYLVIESNSETVANYSGSQPIVYGDASSFEVLEKAGAEKAKLCVIVTSGITTLEPVVKTLRRLNPELPIVARTQYLLDRKRLEEAKLLPLNLVISEFESTLEVMDRSLLALGIEPRVAEEFRQSLKNEYPGHH